MNFSEEHCHVVPGYFRLSASLVLCLVLFGTVCRGTARSDGVEARTL